MDNKKSIVIGSIIALVILTIVLIITFTTELYGFFVVLLALFIILLISLGLYIKEKPDEYSIFQKEKKRILKTYSSAIIEVENLPNIAGKNIIKVKSMDDLVDAQLELREPIYYKNDNDSCFFLLLHYNEACIYILRLNPDVISPTEQSLRFIQKEDAKLLNYESLLDNIENTLVLKLDELRSVKISPVRNRKKVEVIDSRAIKEKIKENKDYKENTLIGELSKTTEIRKLQEQIKNLEKEYKTKKQNKEVITPPKEESLYDLIMKEELEDEEKEKELVITQLINKEEIRNENKKIAEVKNEIEKENKQKPTSKKVKKSAQNTHATRRTANYKKKKQ